MFLIQNPFIELSIVIALATLISILMRILRQPLIVGHILTGIIVSSFFLTFTSSQETITVFSEIGVVFLLFIVGLNLSPRVIRDVGKVSLIVGIGQVLFTSLVGFFISFFLGFSLLESLYLSVALTFSSTIIIMKLLSDKKDLETLYGRISIGLLIVQDVIAIFLLMIISSFSHTKNFLDLVTGTLGYGLLLVSVLFFILYFLSLFGNFFAKSQEFLFLFSLGLVLTLASLSYSFGFSLEVGALLAGVALSVTPYAFEISSKMKPLRDFFMILFFVFLGSQMFFSGNVIPYILPILAFTLFILLGKPLIVMILMSKLGYQKKVSFFTGLTVAQISEFSLILVALGVKLGHLSSEVLSFATVVGVLTFAGSSYFIVYSQKLYSFLSPYLSVFEKKSCYTINERPLSRYDIILIGYNRIGFDLLESFKKMKKKFLVVDYNPDVIRKLTAEGVDCVYGDADDIDFLEGLPFMRAKLVVSTVPDYETNLLLIRNVKKINKKIIILVVSHDLQEAKTLYHEGASYVIMSHFLGGSYASLLITKYGLRSSSFLKEKKKHLEQLKKREMMGHTHPAIEKNA